MAERLFRKDEKCLFVEVLPWYYCFSLTFLSIVSVYALLFCIGLWLCQDIPIAVFVSYWAVGGCILYYAVTRSLYPNYAVLSQRSVYRLIRKSIHQYDEIPLCEVSSIRIKPLPLSNDRALLMIRCTESYVRSHPERRRQYEIRHAQENPEKVNPRLLFSRKPTRLRLVVNHPAEYETVFKELREMMGYRYSISAERVAKCLPKQHSKRH